MQLISQPRGQVQVGANKPSDPGALHLDGDGGVVLSQTGKIDLGEGGRGDGSLLELGKHFGRFAFEFFDEAVANFLKRDGWHGTLQLPQLQNERVRNQVRPHAEQLTEFDPSGSQLFRGETDAFPAGSPGTRV